MAARLKADELPSPRRHPRLYPGDRSVFATGHDPAVAAASPWVSNRLASNDGHMIVRVAPGGGQYEVIVTDNRDEADRVTVVSGPFSSGSSAPATSSRSQAAAKPPALA